MARFDITCKRPPDRFWLVAIILGLQNLNVWTGIAFSLVATVTAVNTLEPFFAWRSRWVLMEEAPGQLDESELRCMFDEYQQICDQLSNRWMEYRRTPSG